MQHQLSYSSNKNVARWLFVGVVMLVVQIVLGGITRLTESGLSITEWKPISGALPPLNYQQWMVEFSKYKITDQFRYLNRNFTLSDFKFIFFWEWLHRTWARLLGLVFLVGFFYFLITKQFRENMIIPFVILFLLGILQGAIGWLMVKSGLLPERLFVGHIQLATHFIAALVLLCYTLWFACKLSISVYNITVSRYLKKISFFILLILFFQLIYGAFMAGLHAATAAPTWPKLNGQWIPSRLNELSPSWKNFIDNKIAIQFIHRCFAYTLLATICIWYFFALKVDGSRLFKRARFIPLLLVTVQIILGILTVINSPDGNKLMWFGVAHQLVAILFLISMIFMIYIIRSKPLAAA